MQIDINKIDELRHFVLNLPTENEMDNCFKCWNEENINCSNKNWCKRYTPLMMGDEVGVLIADLFDTIKGLLKE